VKCLRSKKEICYPREQLTYLFSAYFRARKLIKKHKYDICHCHFIIPTGVLAWMLKRKFGLEYIITAHGSDVLGYNPRFKRLYPLLIRPRKAIIKNAKYIISPSNFLKEEISKAYGADSKKFVVIPNGIEEGKFTPMKKEKYILLVSRLFVNK
jgi:glycosyltransferase involved in cell wall biosynthesis